MVWDPLFGSSIHRLESAGSWFCSSRELEDNRTVATVDVDEIHRGTDVVGLRRCLEVTRQRRRRFARAFIDLHAHAGVLTHGASKKSFLVEVQPRRCSRRRARALGSGEDGNLGGFTRTTM